MSGNGGGKAPKPFIYRLEKDVAASLRNVLKERGWVAWKKSDGELVWNLQWKKTRYGKDDYFGAAGDGAAGMIETTGTATASSSSSSSSTSFGPQRVNHFTKTAAVTRKDMLARSMRRLARLYGPVYESFVPLTFVLPRESAAFTEEYVRGKERFAAAAAAAAAAGGTGASAGIEPLWICKPAASSQGRDIFMLKKLTDIQMESSSVVQRYIPNPFLIGGYKFDMRIYVIIDHFRPLEMYIYRRGLARFSTAKYDPSDLDNKFCHLTNNSINKKSPSIAEVKEVIGSGCKWTLEATMAYLKHVRGVDTDSLWERIKDIIVLTFLTLVGDVPPAPRPFELFGLDIMLDDTHKPWLIEVNSSPAIAVTSVQDKAVKLPMFHDMLDLLGFPSHKTVVTGSSGTAGLAARAATAAPGNAITTPVSTGSAVEDGKLLAELVKQQQQQAAKSAPAAIAAAAAAAASGRDETKQSADASAGAGGAAGSDAPKKKKKKWVGRSVGDWECLFPFDRTTDAANKAAAAATGNVRLSAAAAAAAAAGASSTAHSAIYSELLKVTVDRIRYRMRSAPNKLWRANYPPATPGAVAATVAVLPTTTLPADALSVLTAADRKLSKQLTAGKPKKKKAGAATASAGRPRRRTGGGADDRMNSKSADGDDGGGGDDDGGDDDVDSDSDDHADELAAAASASATASASASGSDSRSSSRRSRSTTSRAIANGAIPLVPRRSLSRTNAALTAANATIAAAASTGAARRHRSASLTRGLYQTGGGSAPASPQVGTGAGSSSGRPPLSGSSAAAGAAVPRHPVSNLSGTGTGVGTDRRRRRSSAAAASSSSSSTATGASSAGNMFYPTPQFALPATNIPTRGLDQYYAASHTNSIAAAAANTIINSVGAAASGAGASGGGLSNPHSAESRLARRMRLLLSEAGQMYPNGSPPHAAPAGPAAAGDANASTGGGSSGSAASTPTSLARSSLKRSASPFNMSPFIVYNSGGGGSASAGSTPTHSAVIAPPVSAPIAYTPALDHSSGHPKDYSSAAAAAAAATTSNGLNSLVRQFMSRQQQQPIQAPAPLSAVAATSAAGAGAAAGSAVKHSKASALRAAATNNSQRNRASVPVHRYQVEFGSTPPAGTAAPGSAADSGKPAAAYFF